MYDPGESVWYRAWVQRPRLLAGFRLLPYSPWHALVLLLLGNPLAAGGALTLTDAAAALCILSEPREAHLARYLRFRNCGWYRRLVLLRAALRGLLPIAAALQAHVEAYGQPPEYYRTRESPLRPSAAPWPVKLVHVAVAHLGLGLAEAWDTSCAELACLKACHDEEGGVPVVNEEEEARALEILSAKD